MNCLLTEYVSCRGKIVHITELSAHSNVKVRVLCRHGEREVRWSRRDNWCRKCRAEAGSYSTNQLGRKITWGEKISKAKKGKKRSGKHCTVPSKSQQDCLSKKKARKTFDLERYIIPLQDGENRPHFYMLCGQSGVGKTTMASKLDLIYNIISADSHSCETLAATLAVMCRGSKPVLLDIPIQISTVYKRYSPYYDITPIFIIEPPEVIYQRLKSRGGRMKNVEARYRRMLSLASRLAKFTGTYDEVLQFLINEQLYNPI